MKFHYRKSGFTLIEILVVIVVASILVSVVFVQLAVGRSRSRDANRRDAVSVYRIALEGYYAATGKYTVDPATVVGAQINVGFKGQGWGRITRKGVTNYSPTASIADSLLQRGYLTEVRTPPDLALYNKDAASGTNDFYLTICDYNGVQATTANAAVHPGKEYAIFVRLEQTTATERQASDVAQRCGNNASFTSNNDVPVGTFNFATGSTTF